jgi:hypothetical protein
MPATTKLAKKIREFCVIDTAGLPAICGTISDVAQTAIGPKPGDHGDGQNEIDGDVEAVHRAISRGFA